MAMMAKDSSVMLAAPPWSQAPPMRGVMPSASATFWPNMNWWAEVGTFTNTASTTDLSMPASAMALRQASTLSDTVSLPGSLPKAVWPMPAITWRPLRLPIFSFP